MPVKDDQRCAVCVKRHEVPAAVVNEALGIRSALRLECRALPPVQDVARHAVFPTVDPGFYCHAYYEADAEAVKARKTEAAAIGELDAKVAATQAAAAQAATSAAQPELPLSPAEPAAAPEPAAPRARRARRNA